MRLSVLVKTMGGAGGALGYNEIVKASADGYTFGLAATNMLLQPLYGGTEYTYSEEFYPIAQAVYNPIAVAVLADSSIETLDDLVKYTQEHPGELKYAYTNVAFLVFQRCQILKKMIWIWFLLPGLVL